MTERVLGPTGSRSRTTRASLLLMALVGLVFGVLIGGGGAASAAKANSIFDYSQCANQDALTSCDSWINGILNPNNSEYREDQVTPQRLFVDITSAGDHSYDISYLIKKGEGHAYDSLATWNHTVDADPCQGFNPPTTTACDAATSGTPSTLAIDPDTLVVNSACTTGNATTSAHQLTGQVFTMWGGTLTDMDYLDTTTDSEGVYRTIHLEFTTAAAGRVYLLFGGHLAASLTPAQGSPRGWGGTDSGDNCGASSISGGPYHIKVTAVDGAAEGSRDNQIMSNAVLPLITPTLSTQPTASASTSADLSDSVDVGNAAAGGTADFFLWSDAACTVAVDSDLDVAVSGGTATSKTVTVTPSANTTYYWTVHYDGDAANNLGPADSACGDETATVNIATTSTVPSS